jgi:hypothetical protein
LSAKGILTNHLLKELQKPGAGLIVGPWRGRDGSLYVERLVGPEQHRNVFSRRVQVAVAPRFAKSLEVLSAKREKARLKLPL